ncbi:MAG: tetratricopeptide repeat protein, partial [Omnitrophica WOR_2 bacterium]
RDDFLAGFTLRDSSEFDEWQFFQTESLRRELADSLEKLAICSSARGEFEKAIPYARRWLALDQLNEEAHRLLMRVYAWSGERNAALRQYRECVRILQQELGVPPLEETDELYQEILDQNLPPLPKQPPPQKIITAPTTARSQEYPLVGREAEWAGLKGAYQQAGTGGYFVVIEGEPGIGKTRLAEELVSMAEKQGAAILQARCYEGEKNLVYGPVIEALRSGLGKPEHQTQVQDLNPLWLSEASRLLPELASFTPNLPPTPALDSPGAQSRFLEGIRQVVIHICEGSTPGILFLDDIHWADAATIELLTYLVRRLQGQRYMILVTWRRDETTLDPHLRQLVYESQRAGLGELIALNRLTSSAVAELFREVSESGAEFPAQASDRLYAESEGLPYFVVEYLNTLKEGSRQDVAVQWELPFSVRDLLKARLAEVSETGGQLLSTAAVIGRSFDFDILREASGRSDAETIDGLEKLISQGLILERKAIEQSSRLSYDFSHEKLRNLVYQEISLARRRLLHRRVAEALINQSHDPREITALAGQIASHYQQAGMEAQAGQYFKMAGEHARSLYANTEALAHFQAALAAGHPDAAGVYEAIGDLQTLQGEYNAALNSYHTAASLTVETSQARLEQKLADVYQRRGEWDMAESHYQAALAILDEQSSPEDLARLYADWSRTAHNLHQPGRAREMALQALALAESTGNLRALAQAYNILGILERSDKHYTHAIQRLEKSLDLSQQLEEPGAGIAALNNLALVYGDCGDNEKAIALEEKALALCVQLGDRHREAAILNNLADLLHISGQAEAAMERLKKAVVIFAEIGAGAGGMQAETWKLTEW